MKNGKNLAEKMMLQRRLTMAADRAAEIVAVAVKGSPPVDPLAIARTEEPSLVVFGDDFRNSFDGMLEYHPSKNKFLLFFNTKYDLDCTDGSHHPRTRFSIAHELAHYFLDSHRTFLMKGGQPHRSKGEFQTDVTTEREADAFAAGLLMPSAMLNRIVNQGELSVVRIQSVAHLFRTSLSSTAIRCVQFSHFPCAVVAIRDGVIAWQVLSQTLIDAGCYPRPRGSPPSASAQEQWKGLLQGDVLQDSSDEVVASWFLTYGRTRCEDMPLLEEYLPIRPMNMLLVILTVSEDGLLENDEA